MSSEIVNIQSDVDKATLELSRILIDGAILADALLKPNPKNQVKKKAGGRHTVNKRRSNFPKWHDLSCCEAHRKVYTTARLLKADPENRYLRTQLRLFTKEYNKLVKSKQNQFVQNMFSELDSMEHDNPRGYMQLINSMREGNFDRSTPDDTSGVMPSHWHSHFSDLLTKTPNSQENARILEFIDQNIDRFKTRLDDPFSTEELEKSLKSLKNNKASCFDQISNEILKCSGKIYKHSFLHLFNTIGRVSFYPTPWKKDILHPIHKSNEKDDPNNFRGISIASCFSKLYIKLLKTRRFPE